VWQEAGLESLTVWSGTWPATIRNFETKAADCDRAVSESSASTQPVFCVDEKTAIQALDRSTRCCPLSPGRAERHGFEYYRMATLSLYAALDTKTGRVQRKNGGAPHQRRLRGFPRRGGFAMPAEARDPHYSRQSVGTQKRKPCGIFWTRTQKVRLHFTPTYSSWLNQSRALVRKNRSATSSPGRRFTSVPRPGRAKLRTLHQRLIRRTLSPFAGKYSDVTRRIRSNDLAATGH